MNKYFLICLISISLIIYTNSEDCSTLDTDAKCNAQSGCQWIETAKCTGHDSCTSATSSQDTCEAVTYGAVTCTFNAGTGTCGGTPSNPDDDCANGSADSEACEAIGGCVWTPPVATCTGGTSCTGVQNPTSSTCTAASVAASKCTYTAPGCVDEETDDENDNGGNGGNGNGNSSFGLKSSVLISLAFLFL